MSRWRIRCTGVSALALYAIVTAPMQVAPYGYIAIGLAGLLFDFRISRKVNDK